MTAQTLDRTRLKRGKRLDATETAHAAVTAAMVVALLAAGRVLAAGSLFQVIASFVVAVLAARRRTRVVVIATCAAASIALILGGLGPVSYAGLAGVFGWTTGQGLRRGWGRFRTIGATVAVGWPAMTASIMFFYPAVAINKKLRDLVLENIDNQADGMANMVGGAGGAVGSAVGFVAGLFGADGAGGPVRDAATWLGDAMRSIADFLIDYWALVIPATEFVYALVYAVLIRAVAKGVLGRLERALVDPLEIALLTDSAPAALPVAVTSAGLQRGGTTVTVPIDLQVRAGEHVLVEGPNGAGKSTLLDALAGLDNVNVVTRPGPSGLGSPGGTARVGQRPEAQVVGTTVGEDLRWGLSRPVDATAALAKVGLDLPHDRPTNELSGGELQRLALASALQRDPTLLLADEVTSMLDPDEQRRVIRLLEELNGTAIVRTSHRDDATASDRRVRIQAPGRKSEAVIPNEIHLGKLDSKVTDPRLLRLRDVGFDHNADKPWAQPVLDGIDLSIHRYELVMIEGRNGSGKTTLARLIAGLDTPTRGQVERSSGVKAALAYQHVRLQLLKATVREELASLAGVRTDGADIDSDNSRRRTRAKNLAVATDLFDLGGLGDRRVDELSGGEQRRVLLAGMVARGVAVLVLDEPLAGLDHAGRRDLAVTLDRVRLAGTSVVVVSHDVDWEPDHVSQRLRLTNRTLKAVDR